MEKEIARIWSEILEVETVAPDSSFYDFGGTTLQAMRICARLESLTGTDVTPDLLFEADTFADFVAAVTRLRATEVDR
jgi:acyl carrier protein